MPLCHIWHGGIVFINKNWTSKVPEWGECLRELEIMYEGRI